MQICGFPVPKWSTDRGCSISFWWDITWGAMSSLQSGSWDTATGFAVWAKGAAAEWPTESPHRNRTPMFCQMGMDQNWPTKLTISRWEFECLNTTSELNREIPILIHLLPAAHPWATAEGQQTTACPSDVPLDHILQFGSREIQLDTCEIVPHPRITVYLDVSEQVQESLGAQFWNGLLRPRICSKSW